MRLFLRQKKNNIQKHSYDIGLRKKDKFEDAENDNQRPYPDQRQNKQRSNEKDEKKINNC